jgi:hypothetical protein
MRRSSLEWLCFFIAGVRRGSYLAAHLHISHAKVIFGAGLWPVHGGALRLRTCRSYEAHSTRSRNDFRNANLLATAMRAKFALALPSGSKPGRQSRCRRSTFACSGARGIRTTPHSKALAGVLVKDPVQPVRCAGVSAMEGRLDTASDS